MNDKYTLIFPERLGTNNAEEYRDRFLKETENLPEGTTIVCDLSQTEYLSSSGLRVLLLLQQRLPHLELINVADLIYGILEETGMTSFLSVERKPHEIAPIKSAPLAQGSNGEIYVIENDIIVKMFSEKTTREAIREEWQNAKTAFMLGVPSVICYAMVTDGERLGIMFERMKTTSLAAVIYSDYEHFDEIAGRFATLLKGVHRIEDENHQLHSVKEAFSDLIENASYLQEEERAKMRDFLKAVPERDHVVHGDFHPNNIGETMGELILLDMAEIGYGHPLFDFIATYYDLILSGETVGVKHPEVTKQFFGLEVEELRNLWEVLLQNYFPELTEKKKRDFSETINRMLGFKLLLFPVLHPNHPKEKHDAWIALGRERFIEHFDEVMDSIAGIDEMIEKSLEGSRR